MSKDYRVQTWQVKTYDERRGLGIITDNIITGFDSDIEIVRVGIHHAGFKEAYKDSREAALEHFIETTKFLLENNKIPSEILGLIWGPWYDGVRYQQIDFAWGYYDGDAWPGNPEFYDFKTINGKVPIHTNPAKIPRHPTSCGDGKIFFGTDEIERRMAETLEIYKNRNIIIPYAQMVKESKELIITI